MHTYPFKSVYTFENNFCGFCTDIVNVISAYFKKILLLIQTHTTQRQSLFRRNASNTCDSINQISSAQVSTCRHRITNLFQHHIHHNTNRTLS